MNMEDIKAKIEEIVGKIKNDDALRAQFKTEPIKAIEKLIGVDLPDEAIEKIIDGVKSKLAIADAKDKLDDAKEDVGEKLGDLKNALGGLFGKK
ncbi:MAG: hypothetical protein E7632_09200 [Ruminococcaceae bacterium]|nr:hypothetical protein [Oscillospiraceae bacterium]